MMQKSQRHWQEGTHRVMQQLVEPLLMTLAALVGARKAGCFRHKETPALCCSKGEKKLGVK
eukprot:11951946-Karenia_brevis.AAC.1